MYGCKSIHCPAYVTKVSFIGVSNITNTINRAGGVNRDVKTNTLGKQPIRGQIIMKRSSWTVVDSNQVDQIGSCT